MNRIVPDALAPFAGQGFGADYSLVGSSQTGIAEMHALHSCIIESDNDASLAKSSLVCASLLGFRDFVEFAKPQRRGGEPPQHRVRVV